MTSTTGSNSYHNTSSATGAYNETVATGTYDIKVTASGYAPVTKTVTVGENATITTDFALEQTGTIQGVVRNESGARLSGVTVIAYNPNTHSTEATDSQTSNGAYSLNVSAGTYDIIAFDSSGTYEDAFNVSHSVNKGQTIRVDVTMSKAPPTGQITGTVVGPDGNPVSNSKVEAIDTSYTNFKQDPADGNAGFTLSVPEGTYEVSASASGYSDGVVTNVDVTGNSQTNVKIQLSQAAYVEGHVKNGSGAVPNAIVLATADGEQYFKRTDGNGDYNITVAPGSDYRVTVFAKGQSAASKTASPSAGNSVTTDFTLEKTEIKHSSLEVLDPAGVDTDNISLVANVNKGMLMVQLQNDSSNSMPGMPNDLDGLGVGPDTEFRINVTVTNYDPSTLLWGAKDVTWSTSDNGTVTDGTDITVRTKAVDLQGINGKQVGPLMTANSVQWKSGRDDRADLGWNKTVYFGLFDMASASSSVRDRFAGMTVTTNAQTFAPPRLVNGSLRVWVAGPHRTVDGNTHSGFYEATIPDSQLTAWGIDPANAKNELQVRYQGSDQNFQVTDLDDGVRIRLDIHYSAGTIDVAPVPNLGSTSQGIVSTSSLENVVTAVSADGKTVGKLRSVAANQPVSIATEGVGAGGVDVSETTLTFDMGTTAENEVTISADTSPPTGGAELSEGRALSYLTVDVSGNLDGRETGGSFTFTVDEDRLAELGASVDTVQTYHYDETAGEWEEIPTRHVSDTTFEATTDSFSTFAISASRAAAGTTTTDATTATQTDESTTTETADTTQSAESTSTETSTPGFGMLVALVALLAVVALLTRRKH